ncbi:Uncharacterized conserved protein, DUF58 family, contains vWF domain [Dyella jiangningensis]|uniref:DUF58 domain-containing protein n=2 Tax=Gammaproteobacteria TaxID=1236 RepID=UPI0008885A07|nr:DUF58 domain-containing protein [Dyella sp. AtDHG13]PXV60806.1 uncharacterized protein (DUF58 family) [Dyella sp. AtDHG13]SDK97372.1 Uncharacterized conserved protein, DUF58 family, contains vWF domain [Dyella jiangningensis]
MQEALGRFRRWAERRLPALTRYRRLEPLPILLHRRRIYIAPTGFGVAFTVLLLVMLTGALNYNNNAALMLTCLLGAMTSASMLVAFRSLNGLRLTGVRHGHAIAGEPMVLQLVFTGGDHAHASIHVAMGEQAEAFAVAAHREVIVSLNLPTEHRGWQPLPRIKLWSNWPLGLFHAWSWTHPDHAVLVWPRPEIGGPPPVLPTQDGRQQRRHQGDDIAALRAYRAGDPQRHIAWKHSAHHESLLVKDFEQPEAQEEWRLDWRQLSQLVPEMRIARLARWLGEAEAVGRPTSLWLPNEDIGLGHGRSHYAHCMDALARLP